MLSVSRGTEQIFSVTHNKWPKYPNEVQLTAIKWGLIEAYSFDTVYISCRISSKHQQYHLVYFTVGERNALIGFFLHGNWCFLSYTLCDLFSVNTVAGYHAAKHHFLAVLRATQAKYLHLSCKYVAYLYSSGNFYILYIPLSF